MAKKNKDKREVFDIEEVFSGEIGGIQIFGDDSVIDFDTALGEDNIIPLVALRNLVMFPSLIVPIHAGRKKSIAALKEVEKKNGILGVVSQIDIEEDDPTEEGLYKVGTIVKLIKLIKMGNGNYTAILRAVERMRIVTFVKHSRFLKAKVELFPETVPEVGTLEKKAYDDTVNTLCQTASTALSQIFDMPGTPWESLENIEDKEFAVNYLASHLHLNVKQRQELLEETSYAFRADLLSALMFDEARKASLRDEINEKVKQELDQQQKEYFLNQQIRTIQEELGIGGEGEIEELREKSAGKKWSKEVQERFEKELGKLQRMNPHVAEFGIQRNYLELMLELPWDEVTEDTFDFVAAQKILDKDHFGIEEVKRRIIEHLAVLKLRKDFKAPILCLYGPPGVGKTSIGQSIAKALGREYVRMSLGGLRDEAEIRGHRKSYIGAMPGRIIQNIKKAKTSNPVFLLDEIDKLSVSHNGDPSSALLEVLDPEQNVSFHDNYLEIGYDLSKVLFIATSNNLSTIQPALRDRMEIIEMSGYTIEEKVEIGRIHVLPKELKAHGLTKKDLTLGKKQMEFVISNYTRESGVRGLAKQLAKLVRGVAKSIVMEEAYEPKMTNEDIVKVLGTPKFERDKYENNDVAGVVTGLAWTSVGGDILYIESVVSKGKGGLSITGNLGTVMKESATIALEYIKANAEELGISPEVLEQYKVHIHVPEGATPKDGPSAGIAMLTSIVSAFTQYKVKTNIAMTGEITLRGRVLPVGGIKEKILAAKRANIKEIILCKDNKKDIDEIKEEYLKGLTFHYVSHMDEVLELAITRDKVKKAKEFKVEPIVAVKA